MISHHLRGQKRGQVRYKLHNRLTTYFNSLNGLNYTQEKPVQASSYISHAIFD